MIGDVEADVPDTMFRSTVMCEKVMGEEVKRDFHVRRVIYAINHLQMKDREWCKGKMSAHVPLKCDECLQKEWTQKWSIKNKARTRRERPNVNGVL